MVEHIVWKWLDPENGEYGAELDGFCKEISKIRELGTRVAFEVIRGLYNEQERAVKILKHQVVDGVHQKGRLGGPSPMSREARPNTKCSGQTL